VQFQWNISYLFKIVIASDSDKYLLFVRLWKCHFGSDFKIVDKISRIGFENRT
jgi:hypothetical protein